eukprot:2878133-Rhodomonas_salina.1
MSRYHRDRSGASDSPDHHAIDSVNIPDHHDLPGRVAAPAASEHCKPAYSEAGPFHGQPPAAAGAGQRASVGLGLSGCQLITTQ